MKKHGMNGTSEHKSWSNMKQRCHNARSEKYKWYGAECLGALLKVREELNQRMFEDKSMTDNTDMQAKVYI